MRKNTNGDLSSSEILKERGQNPRNMSSEEDRSLFIEESIPGNFSVDIHVQGSNIGIYGIIDNNQPECPISDLKFVSNGEEEKLGFVDVLLELCLNKNEQSLEQFSFREIENFLRDSNNIPALPAQGAAFYPIFDKVKSSLKMAITESRGHRTGELMSPTVVDDYQPSDPPIFDPKVEGPFSELSKQKQNYFLNQVIFKHVTPFLYRDKGGVEVVFIDGSMVVVNFLGSCAHCTKSLTTTMTYVQTVLGLELKEPNLMVVTDS